MCRGRSWLSLLILYTLSRKTEGQENLVIGIDLGTSYSSVGVYRNGRVEIIPNDQGNLLTPSFIALPMDEDEENENSGILIGDLAKSQLTTHPSSTIFNTKRFLDFGNKSPTLLTPSFLPFNRKIDGNEFRMEIDGQNGKVSLTPEEASIFILRYLKECAESYLGQKLSKAVLTVPAHFTSSQREVMLKAGNSAGLQIIRLLNTPTAVAISYVNAIKDTKEQNILVYDIGGGRVDVSIMEIDNGIISVLASSGNPYLGGEDFDSRVMEYFTKKSKYSHILKSTPALQKLRREVERGKRELSRESVTQLEIQSYLEGKDFNETLTRDKFEEIHANLFKLTLDPIRKVLDNADMVSGDIDEILLVGGTSKIPKIRESIRKMFRLKKPSGIPDSVFAATGGAAILGYSINTKDTDLVIILDSNSIPFWVKDVHGSLLNIIQRDVPIPYRKSHTFTTCSDYQGQIHLQIFQGKIASTDNTFVGEYTITGIPLSSSGIPKIEIIFEVDSNGVLAVFDRNGNPIPKTSTPSPNHYPTRFYGGFSNSQASDEYQHHMRSRKEAEQDVANTVVFILLPTLFCLFILCSCCGTRPHARPVQHETNPVPVVENVERVQGPVGGQEGLDIRPRLVRQTELQRQAAVVDLARQGLPSLPYIQTQRRLFSEAQLKSMPVKDWEGNGDGVNEDESCVICQSEYMILQKVMTLPCHHHFHEDCILQWLLKPEGKQDCPLCRTSIDSYFEGEAPEGIILVSFQSIPDFNQFRQMLMEARQRAGQP